MLKRDDDAEPSAGWCAGKRKYPHRSIEHFTAASCFRRRQPWKGETRHIHVWGKRSLNRDRSQAKWSNAKHAKKEEKAADWCFQLAWQELDGCSRLRLSGEGWRDAEPPHSCGVISFAISFPTPACSRRAGSNLLQGWSCPHQQSIRVCPEMLNQVVREMWDRKGLKHAPSYHLAPYQSPRFLLCFSHRRAARAVAVMLGMHHTWTVQCSAQPREVLVAGAASLPPLPSGEAVRSIPCHSNRDFIWVPLFTLFVVGKVRRNLWDFLLLGKTPREHIFSQCFQL